MENKILEPTKTDKVITRRKLLSNSGKVAACAAGLGIIAPLLKRKPKEVQAATTEPSMFPYATLDAAQAGQDAYTMWFSNFCAYSVAYGIVNQLRANADTKDAWNKLSLDAIRWAHGGALGWGTLCGSITGGAFVIGLIAGDTDGERMINDLMNYYAKTAFPIFDTGTQHANGTNTAFTSTSNSPLCHVSVSSWMATAGVNFYSPQRADRCARISADMTQYVIGMLNAWKADTYTPANDVQLTKPTSTSAAFLKGDSKRPSQQDGTCNKSGCHTTALN